MIIVGASIVATGTTLAYSALPTLILRAVPAGQTASANGVNVLMRTIGQATCSAAVAAVLVRRTSLVDGASVPTLHGYLLAFAMAGTVALVACAAALTIPGDNAPTAVPAGSGGGRHRPMKRHWKERDHGDRRARRRIHGPDHRAGDGIRARVDGDQP